MTAERGESPLFVSVSWSSPFASMDGAHARGTDWQLRGWRRILHHFREARRVHRAGEDILVVTGAMEVYFLCLLSMLRPRRRLVVYDFLRPRARWGVLLGKLLLPRVDRWLVVRRSDIAMLGRRFGVPAGRCVFVPFPGRPSDTESVVGEYVYSAGIAHRDWETLARAARRVEVPFIVSCDPPLQNMPPHVDARPLVSPEEGRALAARSRMVVVPLVDTELPSGPVVVVDAQANGKAVIATDVGGSRDYISDGETGWLVPPGDAEALAARISALYNDVATLEEVGQAASLRVRGVDECWAAMLAATSADELTRLRKPRVARRRGQ